MTVPSPSRLSRYLAVIVRWLLIAFGVFFLTVLAGFSITNNLPKVYTATAQVQVLVKSNEAKPQSSSSPNNIIAVMTPPDDLAIMQSPDVLLPVIHDLDLNRVWEIRNVDSKDDLLTDPEALAYMNKVLRLDLMRGTDIINITVSSDVPKEAADIANAIADRYKTMRDEERGQNYDHAKMTLSKQIAQYQKNIDEMKPALEKLRAGQSQAFQDAKRDLEEQESLLATANVSFRQLIADSHHMESPVRIISRAEPPEFPSKPNKNFDYIVSIVVATILAILLASFSEVMFMLLRASERTDN